MGWSGYRVTIGIRVDAHGGDREERGEKLHGEFMERLRALCEEFSNDDEAFQVTL